jgi:hypothetical protein
MKPYSFHGLAAVVCAASAVACGGSGPSGELVSSEEATLSSLEAGARVQRVYLGSSQDVALGGTPVVGTFDLLGSAQLEIEVVSRSNAPVQFELWQVHVDQWATLTMAVDATSGFSVRPLHADEDSSWILRFPQVPPDDVVVSIDCKASTRGCTPLQQPGQACPAGWQCDEGLRCQIPGQVCVAE